MARVLGIDYGSRRIGLAICDPEEIISTPLETVRSAGSPAADAAMLAALAPKHDAEEIVVGLPLNMDGSEGNQARLTRKMGDELARISALQVHYCDERYTTHAAIDVMRQAQVSRRRRGDRLDKVAASIILRSFLAARRSTAAEDDATDDAPGAAEPPDDVDRVDDDS